MTTAQQLKHARQMYILKCKSGCTLGKSYYGTECLRLRAKLEEEMR